MTESKSLDRLRELPMGLGDFPWASRRWLDDLFRDSAWHQMIKIEEFTQGDSLVIRAEIPGVDPDKDIQIEVIEDTLVISAEKSESHEENSGEMRRSEFRYGSLTRSVPIPRGVDESKISATYKEGVLEVRMVTPTGMKGDGSHRVAIKRA